MLYHGECFPTKGEWSTSNKGGWSESNERGQLGGQYVLEVGEVGLGLWKISMGMCKKSVPEIVENT